MDLIEFLKARLDEDEETARRPTMDGLPSDRWNAAGTDGLDRASLSHWGVPHVALMEVRPAARACAEHIARWDPAHVLAEIEAKRAIVEMAERTYRESDDYPGWEGAVLHLAQPYADHPDFDPTWRVPPTDPARPV